MKTIFALLSFACALVVRAIEVPDGFTVETLATDLNAATAIAVAPDGRIFIADQTGPLRVWKSGRLLSTPALDLCQNLLRSTTPAHRSSYASAPIST